MNTTLKDIIERRSIRKFKTDEVPHALIDKVIEAGLYARPAEKESSLRSLLL